MGYKEDMILKMARKDYEIRPRCCHVVPKLYEGIFDTEIIYRTLSDLKVFGSIASPGFIKPEGIIIYHTAANIMFKKTIEKDEEHKSTRSK